MILRVFSRTKPYEPCPKPTTSLKGLLGYLDLDLERMKSTNLGKVKRATLGTQILARAIFNSLIHRAASH